MGTFFFTVVIYPLTQIIELAFTFSYKLLKNTGFSLIGVSLAVSLLTLPLYAVAEKWQETERALQAKMKPQVNRIKKFFKGDEQYMILSTYYRQNHYHPIMSLRSAFGILIQIPFFTAAYTCLSHMAALQNHHLLFISDLGMPDALFSVGPLTINVLPLIMTAINCISGAIYTKGLPLREKLQVYILALVFVVLLYNSPAGLVIYWTMNNVFSLIKNIFYKLKNPLKSFYIISAIIFAAALVFTVLTKRFNMEQKGFFSLLCLLVIFSPFIVKFLAFISDKPLAPLNEKRNLRTALFLLSSSGTAILIGLVIPALLIASSPIEFSGIDNYPNPMFFLRNTFFQAMGLFFVWPTLIFFLFSKRIQTLLSAGFLFMLAASTVNAFLFQEKYGYLSRMLIFTEVPSIQSPATHILANLAFMLALILACIAVIKFNLTKPVCLIAMLSIISLVMLSCIQIGKIKAGYRDYLKISANAESKDSGLVKPIFHLSKNGKNVIMIFLDRAQNNFVEPMLEESEKLRQQFTGFTLYKNTVSYNSHTLIGVPPVHGGYEYTPAEINNRPEKTLVEKHNESLLMLPRIFTEQGTGFSAISSDASWANYSWIPDISIFSPYPNIKAFLTENAYLAQWYKDHQDIGNLTIASDTLKRNILWYSFFKTSPLILRHVIYEDGRYWSTNSQYDDMNKYISNYAVMEYLKDLTDFSAETENVYFSFTNNACHTSFKLQAPDYVPSMNITNKGTSEYANDSSYSSMAGVMHRLGEWLDYLKQNDAYNNSRILIVSDHSCTSRENAFVWDEKFSAISPGKYHPIFMFKDFNQTGELKTSEEFMTNADTPALLTEGIIENPVNPFTGKAVNSKMKENGALVSTSNLFMPHHSSSKNIFTVDPNDWYLVSGNIFESQNWQQTKMEEFEK
ncbi:YidC/Oxa1 family membrane protein insertase [Treponema sp.]|uniref:YidC/Oxa1 family membrane protein insertase n=1 Tax=Treponema sp. TaxID=166 RepID=UPI003F129421